MTCEECEVQDGEAVDGEFASVKNYGNDEICFDIWLCDWCAEARKDYADELETQRSLNKWINQI